MFKVQSNMHNWTNSHWGKQRCVQNVFWCILPCIREDVYERPSPESMNPGISLLYINDHQPPWSSVYFCTSHSVFQSITPLTVLFNNTSHVEMQNEFVQESVPKRGWKFWMNVLRTLSHNLCTAHTYPPLCSRSTLFQDFWLLSNHHTYVAIGIFVVGLIWFL